jgi:hypothetical protein
MHSSGTVVSLPGSAWHSQCASECGCTQLRLYVRIQCYSVLVLLFVELDLDVSLRQVF